MTLDPTATIRFAIPKGRMHDGVASLLADAGVKLRVSARDYRPSIPLPGFEVKTLKPRAIIEMLDAGARDLGFAGKDWVVEAGIELVELLDTGMDHVRLVAAAPADILEDGRLPDRPIVVASEYVEIGKRWIRDQGLDARLLPSYGATEVLPPEDADCIIDNTATGATLAANDLDIIDELMTSSTRLYASPEAMDDPDKRASIENFVMLIRSVLEARTRVMVEVNVDSDRLESVIDALPCMREATISPLHGSEGFAVKAAVPRKELPGVIPVIKERGGTDLVVSRVEQIIP
jgi:ATP phosphoribosyltransferase